MFNKRGIGYRNICISCERSDTGASDKFKQYTSRELMEELRSIYADRFVLTLINNRKINASAFERQENGAVLLNDKGRKIFLTDWQNRKKDIIKHPFLDEKIPWGLVPFVQAQLLGKVLRGDLDVYPSFLWK